MSEHSVQTGLWQRATRCVDPLALASFGAGQQLQQSVWLLYRSSSRQGLSCYSKISGAPCPKYSSVLCREEVLEDMPPFLGGGEMIEVRLHTSDPLCKR